MPPIAVPSSWPGAAEEVVTVPVVVADDCDAEHGGVEHCWNDPQILKVFDVPEKIPRAVAVSVYPKPCWSIDRSENEAMPPVVVTVVVPDSVPLPGFAVGVMVRVMAAFAVALSIPD